MTSKRTMPDMFGSAPARPPRVERSDSKFSHYIPPATEAVTEETTPSIPAAEKVTAQEASDPVASPRAVTPAAIAANRERRPRTERLPAPTARVEDDDTWSAFVIPTIDLVIPVFDNVEALLDGPLVQTPLHVLPSMEQTFRRLKASVRTSGRKVSFQTLYAHALAFAYVHADEWLYMAPSDGRREGSRSRLTSVNARITPELPAPLVEATHALAAKASLSSTKHAPALESVKTAGLAWALGRYGEWLDNAVEHPVKAGEERTTRRLQG